VKLRILATAALLLVSSAMAGNVILNENFDSLLGPTHTPFVAPAGTYGADLWAQGRVYPTNDPNELYFYDGTQYHYAQYTGSPFYNRSLAGSAWYAYSGNLITEGHSSTAPTDFGYLIKPTQYADMVAYGGTDRNPLAVSPRWGGSFVYNVGVDATNLEPSPGTYVRGPYETHVDFWSTGLPLPQASVVDDRDATGTNRALGIHSTQDTADFTGQRYIRWRGSNTAGRTVYAWRLDYDAALFIVRVNGRSQHVTATLNGAGDVSHWFNVGLGTGDDLSLPASINDTRCNIPPAKYSTQLNGIITTGAIADGASLELLFDMTPTDSLRYRTNGVPSGKRWLGNIASDGSTANYDACKNIGVAIDNVRLIALAPGDANGDLTIDVVDLGILATYYGITTGAKWQGGDFNGDGKVDVIDLGLLASAYGTTYADSTVIPEPMSLMLLSIGATAVLRRRR
jgi:hypothetical protein